MFCLQCVTVQPGVPHSLHQPPASLTADNKDNRPLVTAGSNPIRLSLLDGYSNPTPAPAGSTATAMLLLVMPQQDGGSVMQMVQAGLQLEGTSARYDSNAQCFVFDQLAVVEGSGQGFVVPGGSSLAVQLLVKLPDGSTLPAWLSQLLFTDRLTMDAEEQAAHTR